MGLAQQSFCVEQFIIFCKQIKNLGIFGRPFNFCVDNYMENLVLLDKPNYPVSKGEWAGRGNTGIARFN